MPAAPNAFLTRRPAATSNVIGSTVGAADLAGGERRIACMTPLAKSPAHRRTLDEFGSE